MLVLEVSLLFILHNDFSVFVLKIGAFLVITPCHFLVVTTNSETSTPSVFREADRRNWLL